MVQLEDDKSFLTNEEGWHDGGVISDDDEDREREGLLGSKMEEMKANPSNIRMITVLEQLKGKLAAETVGSFNSLYWAAKTSLVVFILVCVLMLTVHTIATCRSLKGSSASPNRDLQNFVLSEKEKFGTELSSIQDIETESYESYSAAYCLEGSTLQNTRDALSAGLEKVPQAVREDVVTMALREGVTAKNSWRNSKADLVNKHMAHSYMVFYSTAYEHDGHGMDRYKTCVMVTGVTFTVAEHIVGYKETEEEYQVGMDLDCSFFSCWRKPRFAMRTTSVPVFKRHMLSLKQQEDLHSWMVRQAIESAGHLVAAVPDHNSTDRSLPSGTDPGWSWSPPEYAYEL